MFFSIVKPHRISFSYLLIPHKLLQDMSTIHHSGEKYDYIDARRISLRAPPAPNPVNTSFFF
jgi:hypothetical protein